MMSLLFLLLVCIVSLSHSFVSVSKPQSRLSDNSLLSNLARRPQAENDDGAAEIFFYSDDCFGLISLPSLFVGNDVLFTATFVLLSAATAAFNQGKRPPAAAAKQIPAAVAGGSLLLAPLVKQLVPLDTIPPVNDKASLVEVSVCLFSLLYGFLLTPLLEQMNTKDG